MHIKFVSSTISPDTPSRGVASRAALEYSAEISVSLNLNTVKTNLAIKCAFEVLMKLPFLSSI